MREIPGRIGDVAVVYLVDDMFDSWGHPAEPANSTGPVSSGGPEDPSDTEPLRTFPQVRALQ